MRGIGVVCDVLIVIIREKVWKFLEQWSNSVEPKSRDELRAISGGKFNHRWVNHLKDINSHMMYAGLISRNSQSFRNIIRTECIHPIFCDQSNGSEVTEDSSLTELA